MKDSLITLLFEFIKKYDFVTYDAIVDKADELGYKTETATRKLRNLCTTKNGHVPLIKPITKGKVIVGYKYIYERPQRDLSQSPRENKIDRPIQGAFFRVDCY